MCIVVFAGIKNPTYAHLAVRPTAYAGKPVKVADTRRHAPEKIPECANVPVPETEPLLARDKLIVVPETLVTVAPTATPVPETV
jgi:hypothetical protein